MLLPDNGAFGFFYECHLQTAQARLKKSDEEGTAPLVHRAMLHSRGWQAWEFADLFIDLSLGESTSCTWCSVRCDGSRKSIFTEILSSSLPRDTVS